MYKKDRPSNIRTPLNIIRYVEKMIVIMRPLIKKKLVMPKSTYINTRDLDDILCNDMKDDLTKIDGEHRWIEIHRSLRVRIISTTLMKEFGYVMWSGNTRRVLCKPIKESPFKTASELKRSEINGKADIPTLQL
jgi:hypothetical protein